MALYYTKSVIVWGFKFDPNVYGYPTHWWMGSVVIWGRNRILGLMFPDEMRCDESHMATSPIHTHIL